MVLNFDSMYCTCATVTQSMQFPYHKGTQKCQGSEAKFYFLGETKLNFVDPNLHLALK